jgi:hypothetical protein
VTAQADCALANAQSAPTDSHQVTLPAEFCPRIVPDRRKCRSGRKGGRLAFGRNPPFAGNFPVSAGRTRTGHLLHVHQTAPTTERCRFAGLSKRLMGLEPTTFCMASRRFPGVWSRFDPLLKVFGCVRIIGTEHFPAHAGSAEGTAPACRPGPNPPVPAPTSRGAPRPRDVTRARARRPAQRHHRGPAADAHRRLELTQPRRGSRPTCRTSRSPPDAICATTATTM